MVHVSVIVCTQWELLLVDNASDTRVSKTYDVSWHERMDAAAGRRRRSNPPRPALAGIRLGTYNAEIAEITEKSA